MVDSKLQSDAKDAQAIGADPGSPVEPRLELRDFARPLRGLGTNPEKTPGSTP
jgi:hypothetical protein